MISENPITVFSGVRSSWLTMRRKDRRRCSTALRRLPLRVSAASAVSGGPTVGACDDQGIGAGWSIFLRVAFGILITKMALSTYDCVSIHSRVTAFTI
jgi:hypothetical protein